MPTGYTECVQSGKVTEFSDFALRCARAFGALIELRDEPMDVPLPKAFGASSYHSKELQAAKERLEKLQSMTAAEAERACVKAHEKALRAHHEYEAEKRAQKARYEAMLAKAKEWKPPTKDHDGLKKFMVEQLSESISFDCNHSSPEPKRVNWSIWLADEIRGAERNVKYHTEHQAKDEERANGNTEWLNQLRQSVAHSKTGREP